MRSRTDIHSDGKPERQAVILFFSTSHAIKAEKLAKGDGLRVKLTPIPRHLSSDCGICMRFDAEDAGRVERLLASAKVEYDRIEVL